MARCDCRKCCFDLIPEVMRTADAVTACPIIGPYTYYKSDLPDFKCKYYTNRGKLNRGYSLAKLAQYKDLYYEQLYNDIGDFRKRLQQMYDDREKVLNVVRLKFKDIFGEDGKGSLYEY